MLKALVMIFIQASGAMVALEDEDVSTSALRKLLLQLSTGS